MRDLFAILAIILAVLALGIFRVPEENALVTAGIRAEARAAVYQAQHPISVTVEGRTVTASGRVESEADREVVLAALRAVEGVETVEDALTLLPEVAPFALRLSKGAGGVVLSGHVPEAGTRAAVLAALGLPETGAETGGETGGESGAETGSETDIVADLPVGAGVPDAAWAGVAVRGAGALHVLLDGEVALVDRTLSVTGQVHLPRDRRVLAAALADLPEGYALGMQIEAVDDGRPYGLLVTRDPLMGLRMQGKLPPDFDRAPLDALGPAFQSDLVEAPLPLDQPGFAEAVAAALPVFSRLDTATLSVAPGVVALSGGLAGADLMAKAEALFADLPRDYALHLALVPDDPGPDLSLRVVWDGQSLVLEGRLPQGFPVARIAEDMGAPIASRRLDAAPYPDLSGWGDPVWPGLLALRRLDAGEMVLNGEGLRLTGTAADPGARALARRALGGAGTLEAVLRDDGRPPVYRLVWTASAGGSVTGKLPQDLSVAALAEALGVDSLRGALPVAPTGSGAEAVALLSRLAPWLGLLERVTLDAAPDALTLAATVTQGVSPEALAARLGPLPDHVTLRAADPPVTGARRMHATLGEPQIFSAGRWLPELAMTPGAGTCRAFAERLPPIPYAPARFVPAMEAHWALAELLALARACTRFAGLRMAIAVEVSGGALPALDGQVARRRAEHLRQWLVAHGVPSEALSATGKAGARDAVTYHWQ